MSIIGRKVGFEVYKYNNGFRQPPDKFTHTGLIVDTVLVRDGGGTHMGSASETRYVIEEEETGKLMVVDPNNLLGFVKE